MYKLILLHFCSGNSWLLKDSLSRLAYNPRWVWWRDEISRDQNTNHWPI